MKCAYCGKYYTNTIIKLLCVFLSICVSAGCMYTASENIAVISRETGSGTRSAFIELAGLITVNSDGKKEDMTTPLAQVISSTGTVIATVEGNRSAIGYISLGSLGDSVKGLSIDGVQPTAENIGAGKYPISRNFNIVIDAKKIENNALIKDFVSFIMSNSGQEIVKQMGAAPVKSNGIFDTSGAGGNIKIAGSSSVKPIMEKLSEAYKEINPNASIEVSQSDSTSGVNSTVDGTIDIGMVSRELKDSELEKSITSFSIAVDGIVIIVNKSNNISNITMEQVRKIFSGEVVKWKELGIS